MWLKTMITHQSAPKTQVYMPETDSRIRTLKSSLLFQQAKPETISALAAQVVELLFMPGEIILAQDAASAHLYVIAEGEVALWYGNFKIRKSDSGVVLGHSFLPESTLQPCVLKAVTKTRLLKIEAKNFDLALEADHNLTKGLADELKAEVNELTQIIFSSQDVTTRQEQEIDELKQTKDKLFSIMSHDLRSPVASIITLIEIILTDLKDMSVEEVSEMLSDISQLSQIHLKLLENILQWARHQTGVTQVCPNRISLSKIFEQPIHLFQSRYQAKRIVLEQAFDYHSLVTVDDAMIQTMIGHLLSNALKFTPRGGSVIIQSRKLNDEEVIISVSDTGIGMSEKQLERLFRLDKVQSRYGTENEAGTGLGLIICQYFITQNRGKIWAESEINVGSTFYITLPIN